MRQAFNDVEAKSFQTVAPPYNAHSKPPFIVLVGGKSFARKNHVVSCAGRPGYLFIYTVSGKGMLDINGRPRQIGEGEAVFVDSRSTHELYHSGPAGENWVFCYIYFAGSGCAFYAESLDINNTEKIRVRDKTGLTAQLDKLFEALEGFDDYYRCVQAEAVCRILTLLVSEQRMGTQAKKINAAHTEAIHKVAEYIDENHWQPLGLEGLAVIAGMSKYHFLRVFKEATGVTPHRYVLLKRIEAAKKILKTTEISVYEVSIRVGFKDECHFSRTFKNITQITPIQYRKRSR